MLYPIQTLNLVSNLVQFLSIEQHPLISISFLSYLFHNYPLCIHTSLAVVVCAFLLGLKNNMVILDFFSHFHILFLHVLKLLRNVYNNAIIMYMKGGGNHAPNQTDH